MPNHSKTVKPAKPHKDFPLFPHANGQWAKKVRAKLHFFGVWRDPDAAIARWLAEKDHLIAGRTVPTTPTTPEGPTVRDACNAFYGAKELRRDSGELSPLSLADYKATCLCLIDVFGRDRLLSDLRPEDFQELRATLAKTRKAVALGNAIQRVRSVFKYAFENDLIDRPIKFGSEFKKPSRKSVRIEHAKSGRGVYEAAEVRQIIAAASPVLQAMLLLGINCGFGNADIGTLPLTALDLKGGWVSFPRPKTGIARRAPLWPETVKALRKAIELRPEADDPEHAKLVFITKYGGAWTKEKYDNPIAKETVKLLKKLGLHKPGWGFYRLRHCFRTVADGAGDQVAIDFIMGHAREDMASNYRHGISDDRLRAVTDRVRHWLFTKPR